MWCPSCPLFNLLAFHGQPLIQIAKMLNNKKLLEQQNVVVCTQKQTAMQFADQTLKIVFMKPSMFLLSFL